MILTVIFWFSFNTAIVFAQNQTDDWYIDKPILGVRFIGLENVSEADMRPIVQPYLGKNFTLELFWELQGKLYGTDAFESLESNAVAGDEDQTGVIIEFSAKERPIIKDIVVTGNQRLRTSDITTVMMLSRGDVFDPILIGSDEAAILAVYEVEGYPDATVDVTVTHNDEASEVNLRVNISEGFSVVVEQIRFIGNQFASESTLRGRIKTKQRSLFGSGAFRESFLVVDQAIIEAYYSSHGYIDAEVERIERDETLDEDQGQRLLTVSIFLSEGKQYTYGGMFFEGNKIFSDEELQKRIRHGNDKVINLEIVEADYIRVQDLYFENGYIYNVIELTQERSEQERAIVFRVKIVEKDRAHIENIALVGNEKTIDMVLLRELPFEVGDVFNKTQILQGLRNLYNTQYFSSVTPETPPGSAEGLIDVVISVEEQSTADVNFGVTIGGSDFPFAGQVRWNERNFLGTGQTVGAAVEISLLKQSLTFEFVEPWLLGQRWSGGTSLGVERSVVRNVPQDILPPIFDSTTGAVPDPYENEEEYDPNSSIEDQYTMEYTQWDIGMGVTTSYRLTAPIGFVRFSGGLAASLSHLTYDTAIYRPFDSTIRDELKKWVMINRLDTSVAWDSRDFFLNPTEGFLFSQHASFTGGPLLGRRHFIRLSTKAEGFATLLKLPLFSNWDLKVVLAAHSGLVLVLPQFWVPDSERSKLDEDNLLLNYETDLLVLDGIRNARGWNSVRGGRARWNNTLEFRVPINEQMLWAVAFLDGAVLWSKMEDISLTGVEDFRFSLGAGFRFSIPQFPVRLYFANTFRMDKNFTKAERELPENALKLFDLDEWRFVISLGGDIF